MDLYTVNKLKEEIIGKTIGGWYIKDYINHGKSAVVFQGLKNTQYAAVKVFEPEMVKRYGLEAQRKRIERERSLIGKFHENLVNIFDGGEDKGFLFIVMEYFQGKNMAEDLQKIPLSEVRSLISQLAQAAKFLEETSFAHRDIKPENIGISHDMKSIKLLDFGVIRPFDFTNITDEGAQKYFVGTLQYSPPELLFREEEHSIEAWRAITFYQLGAVLHDILMKKPLFENFKNPWARLVRAVEREIPLVDNPDADADLRLLAQNCLAKQPSNRLDTVKWEDFYKTDSINALDSVRKKIAQNRIAASQYIENEKNNEYEYNKQIFMLGTLIFSSVVSTIKTERLPRYSTNSISEKKPYLLRLLFEPSMKDGLEYYFVVFFQGDVVDSQANFHELRIWACICPDTEAIPEKPEETHPCQIMKGALIEQDIRLHVQECLLFAYAEALDLKTQANNIFKWLEIRR